MHKIIIDTDPGIDDAMAIQLAFAHPEIRLVGLTSVFGNVHVPMATRNALRLVEMAGADTPVAAGAATPLTGPLKPPAYFVHGPQGFGEVEAETPGRTADPRTAARFIVDEINAAPGEVTLVPIAPLTNIALALRLDPSIAGKVARVVIMGGAAWTPGNVTPHAEANIWNDPAAGAEVFAAPWPITMVGLDVTERARATPEDLAELAEKAPVIGGFLNRAAQFYFEFHRSKGVFDGCYLHDPSAVLAVTNPDLFTTEAVPLRVVTSGVETGRTLPDPTAATRPVDICTGVDKDRVRALLLAHLAQADTCRAARIA